MIGIGSISSLLHFILHPETADILIMLKESFLPLLISLILYIVMNVLHQSQESEELKHQNEFTKVLVEQITQLKEFTSDLEKKMILNQNEDRVAQEEVRDKFGHDIKALEIIQVNQTKFLDKFEQMEEWYIEIRKTFENFTRVQLPSINDVVHKAKPSPLISFLTFAACASDNDLSQITFPSESVFIMKPLESSAIKMKPD